MEIRESNLTLSKLTLDASGLTVARTQIVPDKDGILDIHSELRGTTVANVQKVLTTDGGSISGSNCFKLDYNQSATILAHLVSKKAGGVTTRVHATIQVTATKGSTASSLVISTPDIVYLYNPQGTIITVTANLSLGSVDFTLLTPTNSWESVCIIDAKVINSFLLPIQSLSFNNSSNLPLLRTLGF